MAWTLGVGRERLIQEDDHRVVAARVITDAAKAEAAEAEVRDQERREAASLEYPG